MVTHLLRNACGHNGLQNLNILEFDRALQPSIEQRLIVPGQAVNLGRMETPMPHPLSELRTMIDNLSRPRLLIRAARFGLSDYRRERDLRRLIQPPASPEAALTRLLSVEDDMEQTRRAGDASYSIARHIEVLIALMAEARVVLHKAAV